MFHSSIIEFTLSITYCYNDQTSGCINWTVVSSYCPLRPSKEKRWIFRKGSRKDRIFKNNITIIGTAKMNCNYLHCRINLINTYYPVLNKYTLKTNSAHRMSIYFLYRLFTTKNQLMRKNRDMVARNFTVFAYYWIRNFLAKLPSL